MQDSNEVPGNWKLGKVTVALTSGDGRVRRVKVMYCSALGAKQEIERPVQRLILLVVVDESFVSGECSGSKC